MRKTKIVATLGPSCYSAEIMAALIRAGVDAFRFNFSHGTHQEHLEAYKTARSLCRELGRKVTLIQDLQGPKIRVGKLEGDQAVLKQGTEVILTSRDVTGAPSTIPIVYEHLEEDVRPDEIILMDDGKLRLQSVQVSDSGVTCRVLEGGILKPHKGVNFPHTRLSTQALTAKDVADIGFGMETGFDVVALSFVSQASDIEILRHEMRKFGQLRPVLAKLERAACLERLDELLDVSDAVMVARGDLGIEVDIKRLPVLQKTIIAKANDRGVPVITATQMLESMTQSLLPTRAEAADVANAVFDGTDCLMLSGETAVGAHPVEAVQMMNDLIVEAEAFPAEPWTQRREPKRLRGDAISKAICHSAVVAARDLGLGNIVAVTRSGQTALDIAAFRPDATIHAFADNLVLTGFLNLSKGIQPHRCEIPGDFEELMNLVDEQLVQQGIAQMGEAVVMVLGVPITDHRATNSLIIRRVGEKLGGAGRSAQ